MNEDNPKAVALAEHLGCTPDDISECGYGGEQYEAEDHPGEYLVLTSAEREQAASDTLDSYLEECVLTEIPERLRCYFDSDGWKRDALLSDGYGHTLSGYDGKEHEEMIEGDGWYYVYRVN